MAITASAAGAKELEYYPKLVTYNDVTFTLDGTLVALAVAGTEHGGPTGVEPTRVYWERRAGTSNDASVLPGINVTNFDTTNNEVDYTFEVSAAGTNTETIILRIFFEFMDQAPAGYDSTFYA